MKKNIFSSNGDIRKNAYMNWRTMPDDMAYNLEVLAEDYAGAAITLINSILQENRDKKADALIMPILYTIDHSIELYIKSIMRIIETQSGSLVSNYTSHDIEDLMHQMTALIKRTEPKTKGLQKHLKPVNDYIDELYSKIKIKNESGKTEVRIDFARYPFTADGDSHFYLDDPENVIIDIENLGKCFIEIRDSLQALYLMYENRGNT